MLILASKDKNMSIIKVKESKVGRIALTVTAVYFLASVFIFLPIEIAHKVAIPVAILAVSAMWMCPWQMAMAFIFSAIGDYMGSCDNFIAQMGFFAIGHLWFIAYFISRYFSKVEKDMKLTAKAKGYLAMVIFCTLALLATAFIKIVPGAEPGIIKAGVGIYACIISLMLLTALLQRSSLFALGAVLFVFSDFIIAWNMFVEPVPYRTYLVLVTYYMAQWLLYIRSTSFRVGPEMRLMRF